MPTRESSATPFHRPCPRCTDSYPAAATSSVGNASWAILVSCSTSTSGSAAAKPGQQPRQPGGQGVHVPGRDAHAAILAPRTRSWDQPATAPAGWAHSDRVVTLRSLRAKRRTPATTRGAMTVVPGARWQDPPMSVSLAVADVRRIAHGPMRRLFLGLFLNSLGRPDAVPARAVPEHGPGLPDLAWPRPCWRGRPCSPCCSRRWSGPSSTASDPGPSCSVRCSSRRRPLRPRPGHDTAAGLRW